MLKRHPVCLIRYKTMQLSTFQNRRQDFRYRHGNYSCVQSYIQNCSNIAAQLALLNSIYADLTCSVAYGIKLGLFDSFFFLSHTLKRMTDCFFFPSHLHCSMTLQHAILLNNKRQILYADEHSCILRYKKTRKTARLSES